MVNVRVSEGILEGEVVENALGGTFCSFKGIPYAAPPVGELRFKAPRPPKSWDGVRSAKKHGKVCYQRDFIDPQVGAIGSEDCLYLNVYSPDLNVETALPVMVYIHGGGFISGSGDDDIYSPEFLVRHGIVLVTINYRLEVLGFLCLDTEDIPGNAGMKDQVAALRWVNKNIRCFGGDPENVTIFGESAGAASVGYHLVSPMTKGLFKKAIAQSGAAVCWWSQSPFPREKSLALARQLGFYSEDDKELYMFFKSQPVDNLTDVKVPITLASSVKTSFETHLAVVSEKDFGQEMYFNREFNHTNLAGEIHEGVQVFTGFTADDGLICMGIGSQLETKFQQMSNFYEEFVPKAIELNCPILQQLEVGRKLKKLYFAKNKLEKDDWEKLVKYYTASYFIFEMVQWIKAIAHLNKNKVYLYKFSCLSDRNVQTRVMGLDSFVKDKAVVCHIDDLMYLFPAKAIFNEVNPSSESLPHIERVTKLWTNIAKYGNPTPDKSFGVNWPPYTLEKQQYLDLGNELTVKSSPNQQEIQYWEDLFNIYAPEFVFKET